MNTSLPGNMRIFQMPLNFRGSTRYLFAEAFKKTEWPDYSNILYIAPTPRKIRDAQKIFHTLVKNPYIPPRFYTLKQLAKYLFAAEAHGTFLSQVMVPVVLSHISGYSIGYTAILSDVLTELKQYHPSKDLATMQDELTELFHKLGIPEDAVKRMRDALDVFKKYQAHISEHRYYDENDILIYSPSVVSKLLDAVSVLIVDGFYDMTTAEKNLLGELIKASENTLALYHYDAKLSFINDSYINYLKRYFNCEEGHFEEAPGPDFFYIKYHDVEDEVQGIARTIKNLYASGRLRGTDWVIVTCPHIAQYRDLIERVFKRYGIPYTIALQRPASGRGLIRDVLRLLESVTEDFPRTKFTSVLHSPYFKNIPEVIHEHIPSLSLSSGIVKGKDAWLNITATEYEKSDLSEVRKGLSLIISFLDALVGLRGSEKPDSIRETIDKTLSLLGLQGPQEDMELLSSSLRKNSLVCELSGKTHISLKHYTESLRHILSAAEYRREEQGIQIMDFLETRGLEPDYLFFCGLKDGDIPEKPPVDHILPDTARTDYGLISLTQHLAVQKLNFTRIARVSKNVHLSYPSMDGDTLFLPSPYLPWGNEIPDTDLQKKIPGVFSHEELLVRKGWKRLSEVIREIYLDRKTHNTLLREELSSPFRVTDIDSYRRCPRRFFIEKILRLEASEVAEYEIEPRLLGTIVHRVMEQLFRTQPHDLSTLPTRASSVIEDILKEYLLEGYLKSLIKESFLEILPDVIELESGFRSEGFSPFALEKNITGEVLPGIVLKGKIDRIDHNGKVLRIMDYKTGSVTVGSETITKGKELQIPLYASMLTSDGMSVEKAGVYSIKDVTVKWIPTKKDKNTLEDYITSALAYLADTVRSITDGKFIAQPMEDFYCRSCPEAPFCPYIHAKGKNAQ